MRSEKHLERKKKRLGSDFLVQRNSSEPELSCSPSFLSCCAGIKSAPFNFSSKPSKPVRFHFLLLILLNKSDCSTKINVLSIPASNKSEKKSTIMDSCGLNVINVIYSLVALRHQNK